MGRARLRPAKACPRREVWHSLARNQTHDFQVYLATTLVVVSRGQPRPNISTGVDTMSEFSKGYQEMQARLSERRVKFGQVKLFTCIIARGLPILRFGLWQFCEINV